MTSGDSATVRTMRSASAVERAPSTSTCAIFVAPSPSRTSISASCSAASARAVAKASYAGPGPAIGAAPLAPLASTTAQSFVEVSPSTVMRLRLAPTAATSAWRSSGASTAASVVKKASMVARFGAIMPAPFAIAPTRQVFSPTRKSTTTCFGFVSVVMMARAASAPPSRETRGAASAIPARSFAIGRRTPMTPVEATTTSSARQPTARATSSARLARVGEPRLAGAGVGAAGVDDDRARAAGGEVLPRHAARAPPVPGSR